MSIVRSYVPPIRDAKSLRNRIMNRGGAVERSRREKLLDTWLPRLSHLSQFGLFLLTLGALYFTVLPLYQKALLDETIARKEIELKRANAEIEKAYINVRTFTVRAYVLFSGAECSGLLDSSEPPSEPGKSRKVRRTFANRIFAIDVGACLNEALKNTPSLGNLRISDYEFFVKRIAEIGRRLVEKRQQAMREHESVPERGRLNPGSIPPPTGFRAQGLELMAKLYADLDKARVSGPKLEPRESFEQQKRKLVIEIEQERVAMRYAEEIRNEVASLRVLKWPNDN